MNKLKKYRFSDLYEMSSGISTTKEQAGHGSPFLSFGTVFKNYYIPDTLNDLMDTNSEEQSTFSVKKGDIFVTRTSETPNELAMSCVSLKDYPNATFSGFLKRLRPKKEKITYDKFMAFYLRSNYFRKVITNNTIMTLRASFNEDMFSFLDLYLPNYDLQVKIGDFLFDIEEKIRTNNKINDNLEQQIQTIYNYWFTQFEFPDQDGNLYHFSNGKMVWNDELKRKIPINWEIKQLSDLLYKNTKPFNYETVQPAIDLSVMPSNSISLSELNVSSNFTTNLYQMKKGDILFGSIRPYLHKASFAPCDGVVTGTVHSYNVKNSEDYNFILMTLCNKTFFDYAINVSSGTKMPVVSSDAILSYKVAYSKEIANLFNKIDLIEIIANNIQENQKLKLLRDWLLPMLMNGQAIIEN